MEEQDYISVDDLDQFSYRYPDKSDNNFQKQISSKKELFELGLSADILQPIPKHEYYPHQELIRRYMAIYDFLIVDWQPGVGKTGAAYAVGENFRKSRYYDAITAYRLGVPNWIKRMWFIVPNNNILNKHRDNFKLYSELSTNPPKDFYTLTTHEIFLKDYKAKNNGKSVV